MENKQLAIHIKIGEVKLTNPVPPMIAISNSKQLYKGSAYSLEIDDNVYLYTTKQQRDADLNQIINIIQKSRECVN